MDTQSRYTGPTADERLDLAGTRAKFDEAARVRHRGEMLRLLVEVEFPDAAWHVDMIIANPRRYGY
jgi:hypothetical protein